MISFHPTISSHHILTACHLIFPSHNLSHLIISVQFIGPTAAVMAALGDKVSANILAQTALVPSIPWSGGGITAELNEEGVIPKDIFDSACVFDVEGAVAAADRIGYPVMIKASEGGGGKGIRMAKNLEELKSGFVQVGQNNVLMREVILSVTSSAAIV
jgi:biotin carboxylase